MSTTVSNGGGRRDKYLAQANSAADLREPASALDTEGARLLVIKPDAIGDYVLFTALAEAMRKRWPVAQKTLLCLDQVIPLAQRSPVWQEILGWDRNRAEDADYMAMVLECVTQQPWDVILYPVFSRERWVDKWMEKIPAKHKIGMAGDTNHQTELTRLAGNYAYTQLWYGQDGIDLEFERLRSLAQALGAGTPRSFEPVLDFLPDDLMVADDFVLKYPAAIVLAPFSTEKLREWPLENYAELIRRMRMMSNAPIVITGTHDNSLEATSLARAAGVENVHSLCGQTTLPVFAAFLRRSRLLVGGESSPAHLATAVETPQVVISGGGHWGRFLPWSNLSTIVSHPLPCYGCNWKCSQASARCITDLSVDQVWRAVEQHLQKKPRLQVLQESPGERQVSHIRQNSTYARQ